MKTQYELYKEASKRWGIAFQYSKLVEETGELLQAASKVMNGKWDKERLAEEIADVEIMLGQMKVSFDIINQVHVVKTEKIERLRQKLEK